MSSARRTKRRRNPETGVRGSLARACAERARRRQGSWVVRVVLGGLATLGKLATSYLLGAVGAGVGVPAEHYGHAAGAQGIGAVRQHGPRNDLLHLLQVRASVGTHGIHGGVG